MSVLLKIANKYNDKYKYNWQDPLTRPPAPRDINELETLSKHTTFTGLGGAALGAAAGIGTSLLVNPYIFKLEPDNRSKYKDQLKSLNRKAISSGIKGGLIGAATGFTAGSALGEYRGAKKVLKNREKKGAPSYTPKEVDSIMRRRERRGNHPGARISIDPRHF